MPDISAIPVLPQWVTWTLPALVAVISGWLEHAGFPEWLNATIALIVLLITSTLCALLSNKLAGDLVLDIVIIVAYCGVLVATPISPLYSLRKWLTVKLVSPFALFAPVQGHLGSQGTASQAVSPVSQRASRPAAAAWTSASATTDAMPAATTAPPTTDQTHSD